MPTKYFVEDGLKTAQRRHFLKRMLMTPKELSEKRRKEEKDSKWASQIYSDDIEVGGRLLRKEWKKFEPLFETNRDKVKLKKMFKIK